MNVQDDERMAEKVDIVAARESTPSIGHGVLDAARAPAADPDIFEAISDFQHSAPMRGVTLSVQHGDSALHHFFREEDQG